MAGDITAIRFLRVRLLDDVVACLRDIAGDADDARELAESVFANLPATIRAYEPAALPFDAWLLGLARAAAGAPPGAAPGSIDGERSHAFRDAFWQLPGDQREALVLGHIVGLSIAEIADRLGKSEGSVRRLVRGGRAALEAALGELAAGPAVA